MTTTTRVEDAGAYAAQVRAHLRDLPPEQVQDVTDGLEANLSAALTDPDVPTRAPGGAVAVGPVDLTARFGPPWQYAAELRAAAGLDVAQQLRAQSSPAGRGSLLRGASAKMTIIRHSTYWPAIAGFAETLRPLWWVVRGWVWFVLASATTLSLVSPHDPWQPYVPTSTGARLFLAALVVASLWAGRTRWGRSGTLRKWLATANILAVIALPLAATEVVAMLDQATDTTSASGAPTGR